MIQAAEKNPPLRPTLQFVAPFAAFIVILGVDRYLPFGRFNYPLRVVLVTAVLLLVSSKSELRGPRQFLASIGIGVLVFVVWIGPDALWPAYRSLPVFQNALTGTVRTTLTPELATDTLFLVFRIIGTALLVPIIEELFWRGWLMRYLIHPDFTKVTLGTFSALSFFVTAIFFASEHGPFWDVGFAAGVIYNWWLMRTKSLSDCILAHAVTNACLAGYVLKFGHWEYWI